MCRSPRLYPASAAERHGRRRHLRAHRLVLHLERLRPVPGRRRTGCDGHWTAGVSASAGTPPIKSADHGHFFPCFFTHPPRAQGGGLEVSQSGEGRRARGLLRWQRLGEDSLECCQRRALTGRPHEIHKLWRHNMDKPDRGRPRKRRRLPSPVQQRRLCDPYWDVAPTARLRKDAGRYNQPISVRIAGSGAQ